MNKRDQKMKQQKIQKGIEVEVERQYKQAFDCLYRNPKVIRIKKWRQLKMSEAMKIVKVLECEKLHISNNVHEHIIRQMVHIKFPNLTKLVLDQNHIQNIQALSLIQFNKLDSLVLSDNHISSVRCLRKLNSHFLNLLSLRKNPIFDIQKITNMEMGSILNIILEFNGHNDEVIDFSGNFVFKINAKTLEGLWIASQSRISTEDHVKKRKYVGIHTFRHSKNTLL